MFNNIGNKAKGLLWPGPVVDGTDLEPVCEWFTEEEAQVVAAAMVVSGVAFFELVSPWFALPFFVTAVMLSGLKLRARYRSDMAVDNLPSC